MKEKVMRRLCAAALCLLLFSMAACDKAPKTGTESPEPSQSGAVETDNHVTPGGETDAGGDEGGDEKTDAPADPKVGTEAGAASLERVRDSALAFNPQIAGAVAYLGLREAGDSSELTDWLRDSSPELTEELPFLLEIPEERILGGESGKLYCVVPCDENTSLAVNRVKWEEQGNGLHPVTDEILYRDECAEPVLVFVNAEEPDMEVILVPNGGESVTWYPQIFENGELFLPVDDNGDTALFVFAIFGYITEGNYPDNCDPPGDMWWLPPTDMGLADTTWVCDDWMLDLHYGDCDPDYAGIAKLYHRFEDNTDMTLFYSGVWRMEDDCLRLDLSAGVGTSLSGSFPILVSPSGEEMYFQRSRSGEGMPFLEDGMDSIGLVLSVG